MFTSTPTTIEQLPSNIPHIEMDGSNWAIFVMQFREVMQATHCWPYFKGTVPTPSVKDPSKVTDDERKAIKKWEHEDLAMHYLLLQHLPNSIAV